MSGGPTAGDGDSDEHPCVLMSCHDAADDMFLDIDSLPTLAQWSCRAQNISCDVRSLETDVSPQRCRARADAFRPTSIYIQGTAGLSV